MAQLRRSCRAVHAAVCALAITTGGLVMSSELDAVAAPPKFEAALCRRIENRKPVEPVTTFHRDIAAIFGYWKAGKLPPDGLIKIEWIAVDVGPAAPRNTRIAQKTMALADDPDARHADYWDGSFNVTRPSAGWPVGRYEAHLYFNDQLVKTLPFTID
jgi:hypothetical protein